MRRNKIKGLIYGSILGDIIGAPHKGKDRGPQYETKYQDVKMDVQDWTSISERTILMLDVIKEYPLDHLNIFLAAEKLCEWQNDGIIELPPRTDRHIGMNLNFVLRQKEYLNDPIKSSKNSYKLMDSDGATNDALANVSIFGLFDNWYKNTILYTLITTYDSRCVVACLTHAFIINCIANNRLINWNHLTSICQKIIVSQKIKKNHNLIEYNNFLCLALNYKNFLNDFKKKSALGGDTPLDSAFLSFLKNLNIGNYNDNDSQSYALLSMVLSIITVIDMQNMLSEGNGITAEYFKRLLQEIASCGGDSTTNCAIVGSILGVFLGNENLPNEWVEKINFKSWLDLKVDDFISHMAH
jgi:ADP-ribosylglycohydrolase